MRRRELSIAPGSWHGGRDRNASRRVISLGRTRRVHFVGIGGIGMSGIAELVANLGYLVTGSDARRSDITDRLAALGVSIAIGHNGANVADADVVVVSSAIAADNPEVTTARDRK